MSAEEFFDNTIEPSEIKIDNVIGDNACLYRAVANSLYFNSPFRTISTIIRKKIFNKNKKVDDIYGEYSDAYKTDLNFMPEVGNMYLFPATLRHYVPPFKSDVIRESISGNIYFKY